MNEDEDEEEEEEQNKEQDEEIEIDEDERELERLVFGDRSGFRKNLQTFEEDVQAGQEVDEDGITGLEGLADADVGLERRIVASTGSR